VDFVHRLSIIVVIACCLGLLIPYTGAALPVVQNSATQDNSSQEPESASIPPNILGKYRDYTAVKKKNVHYALSSAAKTIDSQLSARSAIIIDAQSEETLFARNPDTPRQPASTIKVLTAMIALKALNGEDSVPISKRAARQPSSKIYLEQHKKYLVDDLINAVLLASANDASVALAEKIAGSEKSFAKMMTLRAKLWGAPQTVCKTATGLTAHGQTSTSRDLAIIFKHAMEDSDFADRMKRTKARTTEGKLLRNHNKALWHVEGAEGGKTGYTNAARQTYVGKFKRGKDEIIIAIMGSERMWSDIHQLVEFGFNKKQAIAAAKQQMSVQIAGINF
jgi:D-alanyl-D-alanine carboxypeptidase (penicillin-binding protein 5/6)